ncbi:MAG: hypothetical protein AAF799_32335 [Myxococcota bacterium]
MSLVRVLDEVAQELEAAVAYLEREREGYGFVLLDEYEAKLRQIQRFPRGAPLSRDVPERYEFRAFKLKRFRYSMIVGELDGVLTLVAFAHHSRAPGYWRERLK